ncbi:MAG: hypothetical protein WCK53_09610 [Methanomicrobiales archaeon]
MVVITHILGKVNLKKWLVSKSDIFRLNIFSASEKRGAARYTLYLANSETSRTLMSGKRSRKTPLPDLFDGEPSTLP